MYKRMYYRGLHRGAIARARARTMYTCASPCTGAPTKHTHARTQSGAGVRVARSYSILAAVHMSRDTFAVR